MTTVVDRLSRALRAEDNILRQAQEIVAEHITSDAPDRETLNRLIELLDGYHALAARELARRALGR